MAFRPAHYLEFGEFRLEPEKLRLWHGDEQVQMRPKAIEILLLLVSNPGRTVLRDEILETVWKNTFVEEGNINFNISLIRKALAKGNWNDGPPIVTVPKAGYRFVANVREIDGDEPKNTVDSPVRPVSDARKGGGMRWHFAALAIGAVLLLTSFTLWTRVDGDSSARPSSIAGRQFKSIAVLPLKQIGDDPSIRLAGIGLADQMISKLGSSGGFTVRPFSSVEKFDQSGLAAVDFGKKLQVDTVIEGTIQLSGDKVRVSVRLFDVRDGAMLWSDTFAEASLNHFALQDKIAENVARTLDISLKGGPTAKNAVNREAYECYLRGRYFFDKRDTENFKKARAEFERAIAIDPNFAIAYSGLADVYTLQTEHESSREESYRIARLNALKALEIDEGLAEAHTSLAWIYRMNDWNWEASEKHFKRAIEINPNYVNARQWYGLLLTTLGRLDEAKIQMEKAKEIDPLSRVVYLNYSGLTFYSRDPHAIMALAQHGAKLAENENERLRDLIVALERSGDLDRALETAERLREINGGKTGSKGIDARLVVLYQRVGRLEESQALLDKLRAKLPEDTYTAYHLAMAYTDLLRYDDAIRMLELCLQARDGRLLWIKVEPRFDPLRSNPRFQKILAQMRLG